MKSFCFENARYYDASLYGLDAIYQSIHSLLKYTDYLSEEEQQQLVDCCFFSAQAHRKQKRQSGEPYICHPIKVAEILAKDVRFDLPVLEGALLHDVIEDTAVPKTEIAEVFGDEVANLVDGVSKLEKDKDVSPQELQARTFTKLVVAMEADPRVVMIKLADRMHNMTTLDALRPEKRKRISQETLDVYVPIASNLGMFVFKTKLQELAFQQLHPWRYRIAEKIVHETYPDREVAYERVKASLKEYFIQHNIKASIRKRRRNLYEVYKKLEQKRVNRRPLEKASIPVVIITDDCDACYRVLGAVHQQFTPVANTLIDFIASPKANGYQSIHTAVLTSDHRVIHFQIRSKEMHAVAESGLIAIWREHNKAQPSELLDGLHNSRIRRRDKSMRRWLGSIKNLSTLAASPLEFYDMVKRELIDAEIQVLTPKGDSISLPEGATVIDFAYHIHTELGDSLASAQVNGVTVPLDYKVSQGQVVELFAAPDASPKSSWLRCVQTGRARTSIKDYLRNLSDDVIEDVGYEEIKRYLTSKGDHYRYLHEMLGDIADSRSISLSQLLRQIAMHEIKYKNLRRELEAMAYKDGVTIKICASLMNRPGVLASVADIIGENGANILSIELPENMQAHKVSVAFVIHLELLAQVNNITQQLSLLPAVKDIKHQEKIA